ncbi:apolipoprotein N-acyltransferase [Methylocystis heyeri]|uniref:Apolipoprotein N-acyltransferase n=1 Tax=Methylocystis heyeri TaxID=391905 RepID=A0A6B8KEZ6_9HYPH|nr:apolipoprotein N-acyltransferase [Methylocystis heyeri]QGM46192.1 apolipoprotein N-acyltransferase [Methylocystis heyeri]
MLHRDGAGGGLTLPQRIILAEGWRRRAVAFLAGACGALALEPVGFAPAMAIPLTAAVWLIDGAAGAPAPSRWSFNAASLRSAAGAGWWLGFGYFLAGLWWLGSALLVEADQYAWALPLAVLGVPAGLALFTSLGFAVARLLWSPGSLRVFALAAGLGGAEWLRGHVLTGFPWNDFGMALGGVQLFAQTGSAVGLYGLDLIAILIFAAPATLIDHERKRRFGSPAAAVAMTLLVALAVFGAVRLSQEQTGAVEGVRLRLMQPNLPMDAKFRPENGQEILRRYLALSDQATAPDRMGVSDVTHFIWPESAFPFVLSREPQALSAIAHGLQGKILITGAARVENGPSRKARGKIFNAVQVVQGEKIIAYYDKKHLVPFGEYLPLENWLRPLGVHHLVPGTWDVGQTPRRLSAPGLPPAAPLVCYEAIFPGQAVEPGSERPGWLLNVTSDGWFGHTSGPYQHFAQARLRAIEEGLPLIRAANTGISAIVDPYGRVLEQLPLGVEGVLDGALPKPAPQTFYSRHAEIVFPALWALVFCCALAGRVRA